MRSVELLFYIICCTFRPTVALQLDLHTEDTGQCFEMKTLNLYDEAEFSIFLDGCEAMPLGYQRISCHGKDTLKVEIFSDAFCRNSANITYVVNRGSCYSASTGELLNTDYPSASPTRHPNWSTMNDSMCDHDKLQQGMLDTIDLQATRWVQDCWDLVALNDEAEANGTTFNETVPACKCFGPLSWADAWNLLDCMISTQFHGVWVWERCQNLGYGYNGTNLEWDYRRMIQSSSALDDASAMSLDGEEILSRRRLVQTIGEDEYISLTWEDDTCSTTCACSGQYSNEYGYGYLDSYGRCECGLFVIFGLSCDGSFTMGNNPWSQQYISLVIDRCVRDTDSPYEGQYRKVSCINNDANLLVQFYNDDPTCTEEVANVTLSDGVCYNYSLLVQGTTDNPTLAPSANPTKPPSTWPVFKYNDCEDHFQTMLEEYILELDIDLADDCIILRNAVDQTEETVACPCLSKIPEWFAIEHMNCNISGSYHGLKVWADCICIGYPDCIVSGTCIEECPYNSLCPGHDGLDDCPDMRRRKPMERRRADVEETFKIFGIQGQCSTYTHHPTYFPSISPTKSPTRVPTVAPSHNPTTPFPTVSPTTPFPTVSPTTAWPSHRPTPKPTGIPTSKSPTWYPSTGWPSLHPTSIDDSGSFGLIFLNMDKRDELLMLAIMALSTFCLVFFVWKVLCERRFGIYTENVEEDGEEFQIDDAFRMSKEEDNTTVKFVGKD